MNSMLKTVALGAILGLTAVSQAAVVLQWEMNNPSPLDDSAGTNDLVNPGGAANPTHLPTGGPDGSGAFQFDGSDDFFNITASPSSVGGVAANWTANFWIKTSDTSSQYLLKTPVFGLNNGNDVFFGMGVNEGKATYRFYNGGFQTGQGNVTVANGAWHMVTFVHHAADTMDIYVDGVLDAGGLTANNPYNYNYTTVGQGYQSAFGNMTLDDVALYNTALTAQEVGDLIPEPSGLALLIVGAGCLLRRSNQGISFSF